MLKGDVNKPIVQVLGNRLIQNQGNDGVQRHRLLISDGVKLNSFAMVATQLNELIEKNLLREHTIVQLDRFITSNVNRKDKPDKKVVIILEMQILIPGDKVGYRIGNPEPLPTPGGGQNSNDENRSQNEPEPEQQVVPKIPVKQAAPSNAAPKKPQMQQYDNIMGGGTNQKDILTHPISSLSPYQNRWTIRARVTSKSGIRTWSNSKGEGKLFSMDLADETGEIRLTGFKEQCDKFYDMIEVDKVYYISRCQLKSANKQYSTLKNDYEMTMNNETEIMECTESCALPEIQYNFVEIQSIANAEDKSIIDVLGVAKSATETVQLKSKSTGRDLVKRDVTIVDKSNAAVVLTLWGDEAEKFPQFENPVVLLKGARVTEFGGGKTLGMIGGTVLKKNPDIEEAHALRSWYDHGGAENLVNVSSRNATGGSTMQSEWLTFRESRDRNVGGGDKPDYFQTKAIVHNIRTGNAIYKACPNQDCNKKVVDQENGQYRCEKCQVESGDFKYRLLVNMLIGDWTSNRWVTMFTELSEQLLGKSSQEIGEMLEHNKEKGEAIFAGINFKEYVFKVRAKNETYAVSRNIIKYLSFLVRTSHQKEVPETKFITLGQRHIGIKSCLLVKNQKKKKKIDNCFLGFVSAPKGSPKGKNKGN